MATQISLTMPSGLGVSTVVGNNGTVYTVNPATHVVVVPLSVAPPLVAAGWIAGAVS